MLSGSTRLPILTVLIAGLSSAGDEKYRAYGLDGQKVDLLKGDGLRAAVLFFIAHDCPISNGYAPEINRICAEYSPQKVAFYVVYVEPELATAEARIVAQGQITRVGETSDIASLVAFIVWPNGSSSFPSSPTPWSQPHSAATRTC